MILENKQNLKTQKPKRLKSKYLLRKHNAITIKDPTANCVALHLLFSLHLANMNVFEQIFLQEKLSLLINISIFTPIEKPNSLEIKWMNGSKMKFALGLYSFQVSYMLSTLFLPPKLTIVCFMLIFFQGGVQARNFVESFPISGQISWVLNKREFFVRTSFGNELAKLENTHKSWASVTTLQE